MQRLWRTSDDVAGTWIDAVECPLVWEADDNTGICSGGGEFFPTVSQLLKLFVVDLVS